MQSSQSITHVVYLAISAQATVLPPGRAQLLDLRELAIRWAILRKLQFCCESAVGWSGGAGAAEVMVRSVPWCMGYPWCCCGGAYVLGRVLCSKAAAKLLLRYAVFCIGAWRASCVRSVVGRVWVRICGPSPDMHGHFAVLMSSDHM